jgi:hypothetical protein
MPPPSVRRRLPAGGFKFGATLKHFPLNALDLRVKFLQEDKGYSLKRAMLITKLADIKIWILKGGETVSTLNAICEILDELLAGDIDET